MSENHHSQLPLGTFFEGADGGVVCVEVGQNMLGWHLFPKGYGMLPLCSLFTGADGSTVADDGGCHTCQWHGPEEL